MKIGYTFDERCLLHAEPRHPESPERLRTILQQLEDAHVLESLVFVAPDFVDPELLTQVHTPEHIQRVQQAAAAGRAHLDADTYVNQASWDAARLAAGGAVAVTQAVLQGTIDHGFALVRPPGHHAESRRAMGFCLFNNVALAAQAALNSGLERVLIVDFDVHHGNGTEEIFYDTAQVLFFSTHQYPFYPGTGAAHDIGMGEGTGYTVNVPLPAGIGDAGYARVFDTLLVPIARRYAPQLMLVSAGYDAHWADPLAMMQLTVGGFAYLVTVLRDLAQELCGGRLALVLEGGYHLQALAHSVLASFEVLQKREPHADPLGPPPGAVKDVSQAFLDRLREIHRLHSQT